MVDIVRSVLYLLILNLHVQCFPLKLIRVTSCTCNRLNWGALNAWSSAPQLSLLKLSCTLLPSSPLAYPTDSAILLLTSYLPIKTLVSRQQSTRMYKMGYEAMGCFSTNEFVLCLQYLLCFCCQLFCIVCVCVCVCV